ncbi:MAG: diaminopimelate decarboxylase [Coriobacteriales bacterium]|jgi:diaminopimelate decarboxylase
MSEISAAPAPEHGDNMKVEDLIKVVGPLTAKVDDSDLHEKHLWVGGVNVAKLPKMTSSPLFIMDEEHIRVSLRSWRDAMNSQFERNRVAYAFKAFTCKEMARIVEEEGVSLLVCSGGELAIALAADFPADRIVMHGNNKSDDEIQEAILNGIGRIVVDNLQEVGKIEMYADLFDEEPEVLLRVKPGIEAGTHTYVQTGDEDSKFGCSIANGEAEEVAKAILDSEHLQLKGFAAHIGSQIFNIEPFDLEIDALLDFACKIREETGFTADEIDLGGGLGAAYTKDDAPTPVEEFAIRIGAYMKEACAKRNFPMPLTAVQPGRAIVANAGITCYRATTIKKVAGDRTLIAVDGGMSDNIRTALYGSKYEAIVANKAGYPRTDVATIVGKHCESGDILVRDASIQPLEENDTICIFGTGAYCYTMSSNYNSVCKPGVTFVKDGKYRRVIRPQEIEDILALEVDEPYLQ